MSLAQGTRLGPYEIVGALGAGGMGEVYRAKDTNLNRDVALKILPESFATDADRVARFKREAQVLASLNHPNIAAIYGIESPSTGSGLGNAPLDGARGAVSDSRTALVMELVEGEDLSALIGRGPACPVGEGPHLRFEDALPIAKQIADALEAAHEAGIVHRDLKPANIKVRDDGTVKVLDFGLAKALDSARAGATDPADAMNSPTMTSPAMTAMGMIMGTAAYMSPEQARGRAVDRRADIWAFGVIVYEMLTGARLFPGDTVSDTIAGVLTKDPDLLAVPAKWRRLLGKCLEKDARKRLRDIGDAWLLFDDVGVATAPPPRKSNLIVVNGIMLITVVATLAMLWLSGWLRGAGSTATATPIAFVEPPPASTQFVQAPAPSPDGTYLAMLVRDAAGKTRIWTRALGSAGARALNGTDGASLVFWSPDSTQLAYVTDREVRRISRDGGDSSLVVAAKPAGGVWLADGDVLLVIARQGFARVTATGGSLRAVGALNTEAVQTAEFRDLSVSPDGRLLLYLQFGGDTGTYITRLDGTGRRLMYPGAQSAAAFVGAATIVREDARVLRAQRFNPSDLSLIGDAAPVAQNVGDVSAGMSGALSWIGSRVVEHLVWMNRAGQVATEATLEGDYFEVDVSRRGRWMAFARTNPDDGNEDIWVQDLHGGAPTRFTTDPDVDHNLTFSHDDREIAWEAHAGGALNIMRRAADGSSPAHLVRPWGRAGGPNDWWPDGQHALYESQGGLWAVPMSGSSEPVPLQPASTQSSEAQISPDGHWLALDSKVTGEREIYLQRLDGTTPSGGLIRVSDGGGRRPLWRGDGAELFFVSGNTIMAADIRSAADRPAGAPHKLFAVPGLSKNNRPFAVTPDGQRFIAIAAIADAAARPATVILNWVASQKK